MSTARSGIDLLLVRHTPVAPAWQARCYGRTDVPLGRDGRAAARTLAEALAQHQPHIVFSSPLRRARWLALLTARQANAALIIDDRLAERDFGTWERQSWDDIHADSGDAMMGMLTAPGSFRPGGAETTSELQARALSWYRELPAGPRLIAVSHGGPIAALVGSLRRLEPGQWAALIPPPGGSVCVPRDGD